MVKPSSRYNLQPVDNPTTPKATAMNDNPLRHITNEDLAHRARTARTLRRAAYVALAAVIPAITAGIWNDWRWFPTAALFLIAGLITAAVTTATLQPVVAEMIRRLDAYDLEQMLDHIENHHPNRRVDQDNDDA